MKGITIIQNHLTVGEMNKFTKNLSVDRDMDGIRDYLYERDWVYPQDSINYGFIWTHSPEGNDYWHSIYVRIQSGKLIKTLVPRKILPSHSLNTKLESVL